jgi:uncharacterized protein YbjT (DUF2867 family)
MILVTGATGNVGGELVRALVRADDPYDVAAVGAEALTSGGHEGHSYRLSGPESLLPADRVAVLGRYLRFEGESDADARAENELPMH